MARIGVIGGGAFGTAMACVLRRARHEVRLWAREPEVVAAINERHANPLFLAGVALAEALPQARVAVLSGPSFAREVAADLPCGVALACADLALARKLAEQIASPRFCVHASADLAGTAIGGVMKNVVAIACGVAAGRRLGEGRRLQEVLAARREVTEGVASAEAVVALARRLGVDMPIAGAVHDVLNRGADLDAAITRLIGRAALG